ncbi:phosphotransferase family protein [Paenibacillus sp. DMB20]|uniref:phosphotransferase family protein n=1 Tax=Paenibacillus sp. DMB20 TaxID=1642570 RepID=UPI0006274999|nr:phosphotransferase [Paenibacillus sp. DMB20]KKO51815.1 aminoglycoside phosphotransferase [Paenibacillus sp. DMB20]
MKIGELLGTGNTANVYQWGNTEVIKIFHDHICSMHEAQKEASHAEMINDLNLRTPKYSGSIEYEGKPCLIYERIDGPTMLRQIEASKSSVSYYARLMAQLHFEMHKVEITRTSNLKDEITNRINMTSKIKESEKQPVHAILGALPEGNAICHYDFHPDNIILSSNGPIIIDWINVLIGHPAADVARSSMMIQSHALPPNAPRWLNEREYREFFDEEYVREYFMLSGMDQSMLDDWMAPTLAARIDELNQEAQSEIIDKLRNILMN